MNETAQYEFLQFIEMVEWPQFTCILCKVNLCGENNLSQHLISKVHKAVFKANFRGKQTYEKLQDEPGVRCNICDMIISCDTEKEQKMLMEFHVLSESHSSFLKGLLKTVFTNSQNSRVQIQDGSSESKKRPVDPLLYTLSPEKLAKYQKVQLGSYYTHNRVQKIVHCDICDIDLERNQVFQHTVSIKHTYNVRFVEFVQKGSPREGTEFIVLDIDRLQCKFCNGFAVNSEDENVIQKHIFSSEHLKNKTSALVSNGSDPEDVRKMVDFMLETQCKDFGSDTAESEDGSNSRDYESRRNIKKSGVTEMMNMQQCRPLNDNLYSSDASSVENDAWNGIFVKKQNTEKEATQGIMPLQNSDTNIKVPDVNEVFSEIMNSEKHEELMDKIMCRVCNKIISKESIPTHSQSISHNEKLYRSDVLIDLQSTHRDENEVCPKNWPNYIFFIKTDTRLVCSLCLKPCAEGLMESHIKGKTHVKKLNMFNKKCNNSASCSNETALTESSQDVRNVCKEIQSNQGNGCQSVITEMLSSYGEMSKRSNSLNQVPSCSDSDKRLASVESLAIKSTKNNDAFLEALKVKHLDSIVTDTKDNELHGEGNADIDEQFETNGDSVFLEIMNPNNKLKRMVVCIACNRIILRSNIARHSLNITHNKNVSDGNNLENIPITDEDENEVHSDSWPDYIYFIKNDARLVCDLCRTVVRKEEMSDHSVTRYHVKKLITFEQNANNPSNHQMLLAESTREIESIDGQFQRVAGISTKHADLFEETLIESREERVGQSKKISEQEEHLQNTRKENADFEVSFRAIEELIFLEIMNPNEELKRRIVCTICDKVILRSNMTTHSLTAKHIRNLCKFDVLKIPSAHKELYYESWPKYIYFIKNDTKLVCSLCLKAVPKNEMRMHMKKGKHVKRLKGINEEADNTGVCNHRIISTETSDENESVDGKSESTKGNIYGNTSKKGLLNNTKLCEMSMMLNQIQLQDRDSSRSSSEGRSSSASITNLSAENTNKCVGTLRELGSKHPELKVETAEQRAQQSDAISEQEMQLQSTDISHNQMQSQVSCFGREESENTKSTLNADQDKLEDTVVCTVCNRVILRSNMADHKLSETHSHIDWELPI